MSSEPDYFPPLPGEHACACIGPASPGDKLCVCERLAYESGNPWPKTLERPPEDLKRWPEDFRGFGISVSW